MPIISGNIGNSSYTGRQDHTQIMQYESTNVYVNWKWFNPSQGLVTWSFFNDSTMKETVVLFRNGYYFGNAYWPIYVQNRLTYWGINLSPVRNRGINQNSMPIGVVDFLNGNRIIAFIFTFSPGQRWSVLEGGFSTKMPPTGVTLYGVEFEKSGPFCINYDPSQISDWNRQTGTNMSGYSPNPATVSTVEVSMPPSSPFVQLFQNDSITDGECQTTSQETAQTMHQGSETKRGDDLEDIVGNILKRIRSI